MYRRIICVIGTLLLMLCCFAYAEDVDALEGMPSDTEETGVEEVSLDDVDSDYDNYDDCADYVDDSFSDHVEEDIEEDDGFQYDDYGNHDDFDDFDDSVQQDVIVIDDVVIDGTSSDDVDVGFENDEIVLSDVMSDNDFESYVDMIQHAPSTGPIDFKSIGYYPVHPVVGDDVILYAHFLNADSIVYEVFDDFSSVIASGDIVYGVGHWFPEDVGDFVLGFTAQNATDSLFREISICIGEKMNDVIENQVSVDDLVDEESSDCDDLDISVDTGNNFRSDFYWLIDFFKKCSTICFR